MFNLPDKYIDSTYDISKFLVYETDIIYDFKISSFIELNESCLYLYDSLKNYCFILKEAYQILNQDDNIIDEFSF